MKILNKKLPYSIKRVIPMAMLAGATLFLNPSCNRDEPDDPTKDQDGNKTEQPVVMRDIELTFDQDGVAQDKAFNLSADTILKYDAMKDVRTIYLVPEGYWGNLNYHAVSIIKDRFLEPAFAKSKKVFGKGEINFMVGEASKVPADSVWYENHGFRINHTR